MKKLLTTTLLIATLVACQKNEEQTPSSGGSSEVVFTSAITTRATGTSWDAGDKIGVFMYETALTAYAGDNCENVPYATLGGESGTFSSSNPLFYPEDTPVDFVAYHPYTTNFSSSTLNITLNTADQSTEELVKAQDFMVASAQICNESNSPSLSFTRKMSRIVVAVTRKESMESAVLSDISLSDVVTDGTFWVVNGSTYRENAPVTPSTTTSDISIFFNETSSTIEAIIIPQEASATLAITIDGEEFEATISGTFAEDTQYNYTLTLGSDKVELSADSISEWGEVESGEMETSSTIVYDSENDVYEIYSAAGFSAFADIVNGGDLDANGKLMEDIDLSEVCGEGIGNWTPIGKVASKYTGTFDGCGYEMQNLYINSSASQQALFGCISIDAVVCNLGVSGCVTTSNDDGISYETAGVVAFNYGTVVNCYNEADISGEVNVGGIVGHNDGCVVNCYNRGAVAGTDAVNSKNIGGICGQSDDESDDDNAVGYGYVLACCNTGTVSTAVESATTNQIHGIILGWLNTLDRSLLSACYGIGDDDTDYIIGWMKATTDDDGSVLAAGSLAAPAYILTETEMRGNETVVAALNAKAIECNLDANLIVKACAWRVESNGYPELDFGVTPTVE